MENNTNYNMFFISSTSSNIRISCRFQRNTALLVKQYEHVGSQIYRSQAQIYNKHIMAEKLVVW